MAGWLWETGCGHPPSAPGPQCHPLVKDRRGPCQGTEGRGARKGVAGGRAAGPLEDSGDLGVLGAAEAAGTPMLGLSYLRARLCLS